MIGGLEIGIATAFLGGLISFLSPCVLPLAPPYLAYLGGTTLDQISDKDDGVDRAAHRRVVIAACLFVLGLGTVFVLLGMGASVVGQTMLYYKAELATISGMLIYALGLHFFGLMQAIRVALVMVAGVIGLTVLTGGGMEELALIKYQLAALLLVSAAIKLAACHYEVNHIPLLHREARFEGPARAGSLGASYLIGVAFAFGWTPCIGPVLATILTLAAQQETLGAGTALLAVYAAGLGVPFIVAALFIGPFLRWAKGFRRHMATVEKAMGGLLILVGVMMVTGDFERFAYWLLEAFPVLATLG